MQRVEVEKGYIKTYRWVLQLLEKCDFDEASERLDIRKTAQDSLALDFLGRSYKVSKTSIDLVDERIKWRPQVEGYDYDLKSVLGYYVLSEGKNAPRNDFCALTAFSYGVFRESSGWADNSFAEAYENDYQKFAAAARNIGMELVEEKPESGKYVWKYRLLPKMPTQLVYYEGDDEYPTKLQILYDKTAIEYYKFEPLAVLHMCYMSAIIALGKNNAPKS